MANACTTRDNVYLYGSTTELRMLNIYQATPPVGQHYQSHIYFTTPHRVAWDNQIDSPSFFEHYLRASDQILLLCS